MTVGYVTTSITEDSLRVETDLVSRPRSVPLALAEMVASRGPKDAIVHKILKRFTDAQMVEFLIALVDAISRRNPGVPGREPDQPSAGP